VHLLEFLPRREGPARQAGPNFAKPDSLPASDLDERAGGAQRLGWSRRIDVDFGCQRAYVRAFSIAEVVAENKKKFGKKQSAVSF
jgi:hypothetical protein